MYLFYAREIDPNTWATGEKPRWWTTHTWNIYVQDGIEISSQLPQPGLLLKTGMSQGQDLAFAFGDLHEVPASHVTHLSRSLWMQPCLQPNYQPFSPNLKPFINLLRACSIPSSRLSLKSLNSADPVLTSEGYPAAKWTLHCSPPLREVQPIFHPLISPYVPDVAIKVLQETVSKASLKSTHTTHTAVTLPTLLAFPEGNQAQFALGKSALALPIAFLSLQEMDSWKRSLGNGS